MLAYAGVLEVNATVPEASGKAIVLSVVELVLI